MLNPIADGVHQLVRKLGLSDHLSMIDRAWEAEIGSLARFTKIIALDGDALVVEATSSPAMQEINLRRKELVRRLNRHFSMNVINNITVKIAHG